MPTLVGHLAVFDQWTEINSRAEGHFLERLDPGAFTKTIAENRDSMRVLFQHGQDPAIGEKPLGPIRSLQPDATGVEYEVPLLDTTYNRDIAAMLAADPPVLGSSFRFQVMREQVDKKPVRSDFNPAGLPQRTIKEVRMQEFGPVTFPAYAGARAGLRSLTDRMTLGVDADDPDVVAQMILMASDYAEANDDDAMRSVLESLRSIGEQSPPDAPPTDAAPRGTSARTPRMSFPPVEGDAIAKARKEEMSWSLTI